MKTARNFDELVNIVMSIPHPRVECVDNGIGNYEYWGSKGVHHDYDWEIEGDSVSVKILFENEEDTIEEIEDLIGDVAYEAQDKLYKALNRHVDDDFDYSDIVCLDFETEMVNGVNVMTFEWNRV